MAAPLQNVVVVSSILLSAGTYLFDFGSNLVVVVEYSQRFVSLSRREAGGARSCDATCRHQTSELAGYFYALLAIMVCCHSLNAILFKLKFKHSDAPLCAAYFLPLIHLYRLSNLLWRTLSCAGVPELRSAEMNGLYCILGSAMEGVPMLILQFCGYLVLTRESIFLNSMSDTFKVSVAASLISAAYNGGTSVQSIAKNAITLKQKVWAGTIGAGFTLFAALLRCLTFTNVIVHIREYFSRLRTVREQARFHVSDSLPLLVIGGNIILYSLHFWLLHSPKAMKKNVRDLHRLLSSLSFSYMSMILGPLYPMVSLASDASQLGCCIFRVKLQAISLLHVLLDIAVLCVTHLLGTLPTPYLIVSAVAIAGYLGFLIAYIRFDAYCGPQREFREDGEGEDGRKEEAADVTLGLVASIAGDEEEGPYPAEERKDAEPLFSKAKQDGDAAYAEKSRIRCLSLDRREIPCAEEAGHRSWPHSLFGIRRWESSSGLYKHSIHHTQFTRSSWPT
ncbi:hypothetical protein GOP47_0022657 [Adiantum capillus-veneris]|uniref:Uncharacterized protein n=1 Tax=Adiantum capillus-veneris TaxID=13818 RepID=A0A9D4U6X1_ADICA|nr:hypothetical protein GOP47_0022657 [Adiantum capillus-veneris]